METNQNAVTQTEQKIEDKAVTQTENKIEDKGERTFTQSDMNKLEMKIENKFKEKYKGYDEWLESKKTETEKQQEREKLIEALTKENNELKNLSVVANADVDKKFQKFVLSEISEMEGEFEDNLSNYLKDNPQFLISKEVTKTPEEDTGVPVTKVKTSAESGVTAILKEKHPELFK